MAAPAVGLLPDAATTGPAAAWALLLVGALLVGLSKTALPGVTTIAVAMFAQVLPAKESTGVMLLLLLTGDLPAIWTYRRDADAAMLRRLVPAVVVGVLLGALFLDVGLDELAHDTLAPAGLDEPGQHEACRHDQNKQRAIGTALGKVGEVTREMSQVV